MPGLNSVEPCAVAMEKASVNIRPAFFFAFAEFLEVNQTPKFFTKVPLTEAFYGTTFTSAPSPRTKTFRSEVLRGNEHTEEANLGRSLGSDAYSQAGDLACEVPGGMG